MRGREYSHQEHGIFRLHVPHEAEHPDFSSRGAQHCKDVEAQILGESQALHTGSVLGLSEHCPFQTL